MSGAATLLAIDVGNTHTVIGVYEGERLVRHWRVLSDAGRTSDEYGVLLLNLFRASQLPLAARIDIIVCSVVPPMTTVFDAVCRDYFHSEPLVVGPGVKTGMPILYDNPKQVGPDRIADAMAAYDLYGGPTVVVDFGTATTLEAISAKGEYLGGAILPGIEISLNALYARAAALFPVELVEPRGVIGKNTTESVQSGAIYGFAAQVDGICSLMQDDIGEATVVATGGLAGLIAPYSRSIQYHEPLLTLHGLRLIFEKNRG